MLVIAAIRTGTDPIGKLPEAGFHRWLEDQINCPKCDATYNLVCDYDAAIGRHFEEESRRPIMLLRKAIFQGHGNGHRVSHFESAGVVVTSFGEPAAETPPPKKPEPIAFPSLPRRYRIQ